MTGDRPNVCRTLMLPTATAGILIGAKPIVAQATPGFAPRFDCALVWAAIGATLRSILVACSLLLGVTSASATERITRGDAEAIFQAFNNGGWAIRLQPGVIEGAPSDFLAGSLARISTTANNRHYCALDWHVILVSLVEGNLPGESFPNQEIFDNLEARQVTILLDGIPLEVTRTEPRRMTNPEFRNFYEAFFVNTGRVMSPDEISVGQHSLVAIGSLAGVISSIVFHIDAAGTGVCGPDDALTFREVE